MSKVNLIITSLIMAALPSCKQSFLPKDTIIYPTGIIGYHIPSDEFHEFFLDNDGIHHDPLCKYCACYDDEYLYLKAITKQQEKTIGCRFYEKQKKFEH